MIRKVEDNLLSPGYVENMNVIIETNGMEVKNFPISDIKEIINLATKLFPARTHLIFIVNLSESIKKHWKMIEGLAEMN